MNGRASGSLLFFASLKHAASLKAVLDLVDKDYNQDAGTLRLFLGDCALATARAATYNKCQYHQAQSCAVQLRISKDGLQIHMIDDAQVSPCPICT